MRKPDKVVILAILTYLALIGEQQFIAMLFILALAWVASS